jgi:hypothetical protein
MRILFAVLRVLVALAVTAAIVGQLTLSLSNWQAAGVSIPLQVVNFFSFFTIESNVATVVVVLLGAYFLIARKGEDPQWFTVLRGVIVTYMAVTGVVYNLLLRNVELPQGTTLPWSNEVLHVVAPAWMIIDWLFAPGRRELTWKFIRVVVIFPIVWGAYTLIRGPLTPNEMLGSGNWYPYPFMNPDLSANGYLSVAFYMILIAAIVGLAGAGVVWVSKRRPLPRQ